MMQDDKRLYQVVFGIGMATLGLGYLTEWAPAIRATQSFSLLWVFLASISFGAALLTGCCIAIVRACPPNDRQSWTSGLLSATAMLAVGAAQMLYYGLFGDVYFSIPILNRVPSHPVTTLGAILHWSIFYHWLLNARMAKFRGLSRRTGLDS